MPRAQWIPLRWKLRFGAFAAPLVLLATAMLLVLVGSPASHAQTGPTCTAPIGNSTTCTLTTSTTVAAGGTLTISLSNPIGATISAVAGEPSGCTVATGLATATVSIACAVASLGIPSGTALTENISGVAAGVEFVTETVVYNANGPASAATGGGTVGSCGALLASLPPAPPPVTATCTNTPSAQALSGWTLSFAITAVPGQMIQVNGAPATVGTGVTACPLVGIPPFGPTPPGGTLTVAYGCGVGQFGVNPPTAVQITVTNVNGPGGTPTEITTALPPAPPPPVTRLGSCSGSLAPTVGSTVTCSNTPGATTVAGGTLAFTITAAPSQTIFVAAGNAPSLAGTCPLSTTLPTSVSFPGSTLTLAYTCDTGQSAPAAPNTITITNANGVAGIPNESTTANAPSPTGSIPASNTDAVVFSVLAAAVTPTVVSGQGLTVSLTAANANNLVPGQLVTFTATASTANTSATITIFHFDFGDGSAFVTVVPTGQNAAATVMTTHTYARPGPYLAAVLASDSSGQTGTASTGIALQPTVSYLPLYQPPPPALASAGTALSVTLTPNPAVTRPGEPVTFTFTAVTQMSPALALGYNVPASNAGPTPQTVKIDFGDGSPAQLVLPNRTITHSYWSAGQYNVTLTATDNFGNIGQATAQVFVPAQLVNPPPTATPGG